MKTKKELVKPDVNKIGYTRKYRIGTRYMNKLNELFQYAKVDFGIVSKETKTGKVYRNIQYAWIRVK